MIENPFEDLPERKNYDLINNYWTDPHAPISSYDYNPAVAEGELPKEMAKCVNLTQETQK